MNLRIETSKDRESPFWRLEKQIGMISYTVVKTKEKGIGL